jgi:hypothetical protein
VTEAMPRAAGATPAPHIFADAAATADWPTWDAAFASRLSRALVEAAVAAVPDSFLRPLLARPALDAQAGADALTRRRAAYVAFLWKRLESPRAFAQPPLARASGTT